MIGKIELAAFSVGTAVSQEETLKAYRDLNAAREQLYTYIEDLEYGVKKRRTHKRRF